MPPGRQPEPEPEQGVKVVYCGGCNPQIDRRAVATELLAASPGKRAAVHISGCARACASGHRLSVGGAAQEAPAARGDHAPVLVVAGELVDGVPTPAVDIALALTRKLKE